MVNTVVNRKFAKLEEFKQKQESKNKLLPCEFDFQVIQTDEDPARKSVCVYSETSKDLSNIFAKYEEIQEIEGGSLVTFSKSDRARKAVSKYHGKEGLIVCEAFTPPLIAQGHNPDIFVIRNVPEEITIPQVWASVSADENLVSHMKFLPTSSRDVLILCRDKEGQKRLLAKHESRSENWTIKIELWYEFCARMIKRNVLFVENLTEETNLDSLKKLLGVADDGFEFVQINDVHRFALIVCKSNSILDGIASLAPNGLKISLLKKLNDNIDVKLCNLHETTNKSDIHTFLSGCGNILKVSDVRLVQKTGKKWATVYFETSKGVENALKLNGTDLKGLPVTVELPTDRKPSSSVFLTNLHRCIKPIDLCLMFQDCGYIESVYVPNQRGIVNVKQAGVVKFRDTEAVKSALAKTNKIKFRGIRITVHQDDPLECKKRKKRSGAARKPRPSVRYTGTGTRSGEDDNDEGEGEEPSPAKRPRFQKNGDH